MAAQHIIGGTSVEVIKNRVIVKKNECVNESHLGCNDRVQLGEGDITWSYCQAITLSVLISGQLHTHPPASVFSSFVLGHNVV